MIKRRRIKSITVIGQLSQKDKRLIEPGNILLPYLHTKLGVVKNFLKTVAHRAEVFACLKTIFPGLSDAERRYFKFIPQIFHIIIILIIFLQYLFFYVFNKGVVDGLDIRKFLKSVPFNQILDPKHEAEAWKGIKGVKILMNDFFPN